MRRFAGLVAAALAGAVLLLPAQALAKSPGPRLACTGNPAATPRLDLGSTYGFYALPAKKPLGIVVYDHGYGHNAEDWRPHLSETAQRDGVIAVAMNYVPDEGATRRGWRVSEGADATIAAAKAFERACPLAKTIVAYGISMGGNTSGLAAASHATRHDGRPLFDYWWDIEGATNVIETYAGARALAATGNAFAVGAQQDIEAEMGGPLEQHPDTYASHSVVTRAEDIKASGIKGVVMVHGVGDGLVPHDQSREMQARLRQVGIPVEFFSAVTHGPDSEAGTTLDGYLPVAHDSPFAGHGSEVSNTQLVIKTGFDRLDALYWSSQAPDCREFVVDGTTGLRAPTPSLGC
jgi:acetyl esterase/lipase